MKTNNSNQTDFHSFVSRLETEDQKHARLFRGIKILYMILLPIYIILLLLELREGEPMTGLINGALFMGAIAILIFTFQRLHNEYKTVDYSEPTLQMLKKAVQRYTPFSKFTYWVFFAVLFMDASFILKEINLENILQRQLSFTIIIAVSIAIGLIRWRIKCKPLRDRALAMIREIEESN